MEAIRSSETSVYTRSTQRYIREDGILHDNRYENLKSYDKDGVCRTRKRSKKCVKNLSRDTRREEIASEA
jgi:hypothetical protein